MSDERLEELKRVQKTILLLNNKLIQLIQALEDDSMKRIRECYRNIIDVDEEDLYSFEEDVLVRVRDIMNNNFWL